MYRVSKFSFNFFRKNFVQPTKMLTKPKIFVNFSRKIRSKCSTSRLKSNFIRKNTIFLMRNGKITILIERKFNENFAKMKNFRENEVKYFVENFKRKWTNFVRTFSRISFNQNFDGNPTKNWSCKVLTIQYSFLTPLYLYLYWWQAQN